MVALNVFFHCFAVTFLPKLAMLYVTHNARYGRIMERNAIHPGKHLAEQLQELELSAAKLARQIQVPTNRITEIMNEQRAITGDTALRLGHFFGTSAEFWLNLQKLYELRLAEAKTGAAIKKLPTLAGMVKKPGKAGATSA